MVKKQHITFGGFFLPATLLKILTRACASVKASSDTRMAMLVCFALPKKKIAAPKNDTLFLYHCFERKQFYE